MKTFGPSYFDTALVIKLFVFQDRKLKLSKSEFQLNQATDRKNENNNCLKEQNELKFCEVSLNSISNRCQNFQISVLKNKNVVFLFLGRSLLRSDKIKKQIGEP